MTISDMIQLAISALGIVVTVALVWGAGRKLEGSIEERLKLGDKNFEKIDLKCKEHGEELKKLEVDLAVNTKQQQSNVEAIHNMGCRVDKLDNRVTVLETKK